MIDLDHSTHGSVFADLVDLPYSVIQEPYINRRRPESVPTPGTHRLPLGHLV